MHPLCVLVLLLLALTVARGRVNKLEKLIEDASDGSKLFAPKRSTHSPAILISKRKERIFVYRSGLLDRLPQNIAGQRQKTLVVG